MKPFPFLLALFALLAHAAASGDDKLYLAAGDTEALLAKEGQRVIVHGEATGSKKSASGTNFVNFKDATFFLVTFKSDLSQFSEGEPTDLYEGKRLAVEGAVSIYQGKPQIKLTDPKQVTILAADAVFPPPADSKPESESAPPAKVMTEKPAPETAPAPETPKRKPPVDPSEYFKKKG
jgi:hypothetical protein